jgi:pyruvate dehydrogenase E2 component (dihydrolipoamide acetyltransferase)
VYAGPSVRRLARELEINLALLQGSGRKGRITREDLEQYIKAQMRSPGVNSSMAPTPAIDFSQFGPIETSPMNKIKRLTGQHVHRSWATVPHVTQFDEADITEMEAFRQAQKAAAVKQGYKLTPIVFVMKAVVAALRAFPHFNASLNPTQDAIILKQYYHIGVAVDTPNGLVVPVIRDVDQKSLSELSKELVALSEKARTKGLAPSDMAGGCFTISSLGGIGGTAFTPIVNVPEVAILGLSKASMKPVFSDGEFKPRLMMPLSLSYDHRVIDGADGARFSQFLASRLADIRTLLL